VILKESFVYWNTQQQSSMLINNTANINYFFNKFDIN